MTNRFWHGTSTAALASIREEGLRCPFLADDYDRAWYYAEQQADEDGSEPVMLEVFPDEQALRYDGAAVAEPVMVDEDAAAAAMDAASASHPEWSQNGYLSVPASEWRLSWEAVGSCRAEGVVDEWKVDCDG